MLELLVRPGTRLDQLLKIANIVSSGGEAKFLIQDGLVTVNARVETRRGYKVRNGDIVELNNEIIKVST